MLQEIAHTPLKATFRASSVVSHTSFAIAPPPLNIFALAASSGKTTTSFTLITLTFGAIEMAPFSKP